MEKLNNKIFIGFLFFLSIFFFTAPAQSARWYVDSLASPGGDGKSWAHAFKNIQTALNNCSSMWVICMSPTDEIWVKRGTYSLSEQINVSKYVTIYGGFNGTEQKSGDRDWTNNRTIIYGKNSVRCLYVTAPAIIDGFIIYRGKAVGENGGGIYIDSPPIECTFPQFSHVAKIRNCSFEYNNAEVRGGGIYDHQSDPLIQNCVFIGNSSPGGGGIQNWNSSPTIEKCRFKGNLSTSPGSWGGGAICSDYLCYGTITNCIFHLNTSESHGGAIAYHMAYPYIKNCTFTQNESNFSGGALYANTGGPRITNCIFWGDSPDELAFDYSSTDWRYVRYSDIDGGYSGPGYNNINANPRFVDGPIDVRLSSDSPCIDTGTNSDAPDEDIDSYSRPIDGNGDGTVRCDMGAYEFYLPDVTIELNLPEGWSMISLPVEPDSLKLSGLFPGAVVVYGYARGAGYTRVADGEALKIGKGYWILLNDARKYTLTGQSIDEYTLQVHEDGWEMIGGCTYPAEAITNGCNIKVIYRYDIGSGYQRMLEFEDIEPGKGYWIMLKDIVNQAELNISSSMP
ncbi:MAG: choice-of-anchor Q domain-containing protein [bacterium]